MARVLITDDAVAAELISQRRASGVDTYDEMWNGVYHVVPAGSQRHGQAQAAIIAVLREWAWPRVPALEVTGPINVGTPHSYRVPDAAVLASDVGDDAVFVPSALMVVEVLSPGDDSLKKLDFYLNRGVSEVLIVDPQNRSLELRALQGNEYVVVDSSSIWGARSLPVVEMRRAMGW